MSGSWRRRAGCSWPGSPSATPLLPGAGVLAFVDMDSMQKRVYGHAKAGAGFGHTKIGGKSLLVPGLNVLAAVVSTPLAAPLVAATRLRGGRAGCARMIVVRMHSAYYAAKGIAAIGVAGAFFSVTVRMDAKVRAAIAAIGQDAWTPIAYPHAIWD